MWQKDLSDYEYIEGANDDTFDNIGTSYGGDGATNESGTNEAGANNIITIAAEELDTFNYNKSGDSDDNSNNDNNIIEEDNIKSGGFNDYENYHNYNNEDKSESGRVISMGDWVRMGGRLMNKDNNESGNMSEEISEDNSNLLEFDDDIDDIESEKSNIDNIKLDFDDNDDNDNINDLTHNEEKLEFEGGEMDISNNFDKLEFAGGEDDTVVEKSINIDSDKATIDDFRKIIPKKITECSIGRSTLDPTFKGVCTSEDVLKSAASALNIISSRPIEDVAADVKKKTGCSNEVCVLRDKRVVEKLGDDVITEEISKNFKLSGPVDITLLSNINIDDAILNQWSAAFPDFFNMGFTMSDFDQRSIEDNIETDRTGNGLGRNNIGSVYAAGFKTAASVLNTDVHSGAGKHWMAIFVDMRNDKNITIEFFNSSGNAPQVNFKSWMSAAKTILEAKVKGAAVKDIIVTRYMHQHSRTECGVYALYYIWARLNGVPYSIFRSNRVPDELMLEFRQHLFAGKIFRSGEQWNFDRYKNAVKVKWESGFSY